MSVGILMPYRDIGCPHRTRALEHITSLYAAAHPEWPLVIGRHDEGPWVKAQAISDALAQTQAEILILADADCWTEGVTAAVEAVAVGATWSVPFRAVFRLDEASTPLWIAGASHYDLSLTQRPYLGELGGGVVVMRRDAYEAAPFDIRFAGWGSEDEAAAAAWRCLYGPPVRVKDPLVHLYHPAQERACRSFGSGESRDLKKRYVRAALRSPEAVRALIEEATPCRSQPS